MRKIFINSIIALIFTFTACSKPDELKPLEEVVKTPIRSVSGENCSIYEEDVFSLNGKKEVSECEIRQNPNIFNGKIIRVKTNYAFMIHGAFLDDHEKCSGVSNSVHESISVGFRSKKDFDYIDKMRVIPVSIVAVGKFSVKTPSRQSDSIYDNTSFVFDIICLEKAGIWKK